MYLSQALVIDEDQDSDYPCLGNVGEEIVIQGTVIYKQHDRSKDVNQHIHIVHRSCGPHHSRLDAGETTAVCLLGL